MSACSETETVFFVALEKATLAERSAYLDEACAGDGALRRRVERLLASQLMVGTFLERPVVEVAAIAAIAPPESSGGEDVPAGGASPDERLDFLGPSRRPDGLGRLGHYEILEVVGRGGMGIVLRAFDEKLHRVVAIKVLAPVLAANGPARERFVREAQATAAVSHDNVIAIHAVEDDGPVPYLVMPFIDGPTLQEKVDRHGPLPVAEVLRIGREIVAGLAAAHARGLVHRDVKPGNILLENGVERVKITDFGLAQPFADGRTARGGLIAGTPAYMSPEQASGGAVDHRSDLFSLGSVLYTLCAGHAPFRGGTTKVVLQEVRQAAPQTLHEIDPEIPDWLEAIIARLHAKDPDVRFQTAGEVADLLAVLLARWQQAEAAGDPAGRRPDPQSDEARRNGGRRALRTVLVGGVAVLAIGVAAIPLIHRGLGPGTPRTAIRDAGRGTPWRLGPSLRLEELANRPSPPDTVKERSIDRPAGFPPETLAVLGSPGGFRFPDTRASHWMAQSRDGHRLAVPCSTDVLVFETRGGTLLRTLTGHDNQAYRPVFSPDGTRVAAGSGHFAVRVWDVASGREILALNDHRTWSWCVAFDPEGKRLVSADAAGWIIVRDADGRPLHRFRGHEKGVNHLAFSPDGRRLATASLDRRCRIWDAATWREIRALRRDDQTFEAVAWHPDGTRLAAGDDAAVIVWDTEADRILHRLATPGKGLIAFTPDGRTLLTARHIDGSGQRHAFTRWDVTSGTRSATIELPTRGKVAYFQLSPDARTIFVTQDVPYRDRVRVFDAETGEDRLPELGHNGAVLCLAISRDGRTIASGGADRTARLWDLAGWRPGDRLPPVRALEGHHDVVRSVAFSPDGRLVATGGLNGRLLLWEVAGGRLVRELAGHSRKSSFVTFSSDGRTVAAGGSDGTVDRWDVDTGRPLPPWPGHVGEVRPVAFSPDGRLAASGGKDRTVRVVDAADGQPLQVFRGNTPFTDLAFSDDGRILAAVDESPSCRLNLWDLDTQEERTLTGHGAHILGLALHPTGRRAATASWDGTVRLWDLNGPGREERRFEFGSGVLVHAVAFTPEGRYLAAGLENGLIAILRADGAAEGDVLRAERPPSLTPPARGEGS
jgi:WD40 repeat protein